MRFFTHLPGAGPPPGKAGGPGRTHKGRARAARPRQPAYGPRPRTAADPALLDQLPFTGDILPGLPPALKARLFAAFGLEILWNKPGQQVTVFAEITEITENTLQAISGITDPSQDGYHDTSTDDADSGQPAPMWDLTNTHRFIRTPRSLTFASSRPACAGPIWGKCSLWVGGRRG